LLYGVDHQFFSFSFFLVCNNFVFPWFSILEHLFFYDLILGSNIYIHYIHLWSDCFYINYWFSIWSWCIFPLKHIIHFCKFWTICHLVSIQATYMICIWCNLLNFLILSGSLCCYYNWFFFFSFYTCLHCDYLDHSLCVVLPVFPSSISTQLVSPCLILLNSMYSCLSFWIFQWHLQNVCVNKKKLQ